MCIRDSFRAVPLRSISRAALKVRPTKSLDGFEMPNQNFSLMKWCRRWYCLIQRPHPRARLIRDVGKVVHPLVVEDCQLFCLRSFVMREHRIELYSYAGLDRAIDTAAFLSPERVLRYRSGVGFDSFAVNANLYRLRSAASAQRLVG